MSLRCPLGLLGVVLLPTLACRFNLSNHGASDGSPNPIDAATSITDAPPGTPDAPAAFDGSPDAKPPCPFGFDVPNLDNSDACALLDSNTPEPTETLTSGNDYVLHTDNHALYDAGDTEFNDPIEIYTDIDVNQSGAPDIFVLLTEGFVVQGGATVSVVGDRALAIVSTGNITITGTLSASAYEINDGADTAPGAGGDDPTLCATGAGTDGVQQQEGVGCNSNDHGGSGGGGGAFGSAGGTGGRIDEPSGSPDPTPGGDVAGNLDLMPLRGGCHGGTGGHTGGGLAGAGGGALQLAAAGTIDVDGVVAAAGAGGRGCTVRESGGGGGGSGGGILLVADQITISSTAKVTANGGAGSAGTRDDGSSSAGENGQETSASPAQGSTSSEEAGDGGDGAAGVTSAADGLDGQQCSSRAASGGGGGGGVGRIRFVAATTPSKDVSAVVSPPAN